MGSILAKSSDNRWLSSQRSTARCMFSHTSGLVFSKRASFKAVAAVTGWSSARIRCRLWRDMCRRSAKPEMESPVAGRISSLSTAPGCVGLLVRFINDSPQGQPVLHRTHPNRKLIANCHLPEPSNGPLSHEVDGSGNRVYSCPMGELMRSKHAAAGEFWIDEPGKLGDCYRSQTTQTALYVGSCESRDNTVTLHETVLQALAKQYWPNLRDFRRCVCRKNNAITVRKWSDRPLSTAADIPLHSKLFLHQVRSIQ